MPANEEAIRKFLYEVYGYSKIDELVRRKKPGDVKVMDFLEGTMIGTSKLYSPLPSISKVKTTEEGLPRAIVVDVSQGDTILPYYVENRTLFNEMKEQDVGDYINSNVSRLFPNGTHKFARHGTKPTSMWHHEFRDENFRLYIEGSTSSNLKLTSVDFNSSPEIKDDINRIVHNYYGMRNSITGNSKT